MGAILSISVLCDARRANTIVLAARLRARGFAFGPPAAARGGRRARWRNQSVCHAILWTAWRLSARRPAFSFGAGPRFRRVFGPVVSELLAGGS
jgi:hypothetical protein